jgi:uncharacterized protein (TIGR02246 family)
MKYSFLTTALFCVSVLSFAESHVSDEKAINRQIDAMLHSWNVHDFRDMDQYTTEDVAFVNPLGMVWKGRKEFQQAMTSLHSTILKNADNKKISSNIRFITNNVAVVHLISHIGSFKNWDGKDVGNNNDVGTYVFVKRNGQWLLTAGQEVGVDAGAGQFNPVKGTGK